VASGQLLSLSQAWAEQWRWHTSVEPNSPLRTMELRFPASPLRAKCSGLTGDET